MREDQSSYSVNLDLDLGREPQARDESHRLDDATFRLGIVGDFSAGRCIAGPGGGAAAWRVDRDDLEDVLAAIAPSLQLDIGGGVVAEVRIRALDDFHPDALFAHVPQFARLREARQRLADPATFRRAAAELSAAPAPPPAPRAPSTPVVASSGSLLDAIVGAPSPSNTGGGQEDDLYAFVQRAMAPYLVDRPDPRQGEMVAQVDVAIAASMRALLHHPRFQALESLWRGMDRLVRHVETNERLHVYVIDRSREAFLADLAAPDLQASALRRRLAELAPGDEGGWGVLAAHYPFGGDAADLEALERLAALGMALDAPWLAEANPDLALGALPGDAGTTWQRLRASAAGRYLGLALPRVLVRLPYGKGSDECERFAFEELENPDAHGSYLWGNPALGCATVLAQGFSERGAGLAPGSSTLLTGLPLHLTKRDGVTTAKPCAEVLMREDDALALIEAGFIPMLSYRDEDAVRVGRVQSVARPSSRLAGRWAR